MVVLLYSVNFSWADLGKFSTVLVHLISTLHNPLQDTVIIATVKVGRQGHLKHFFLVNQSSL